MTVFPFPHQLRIEAGIADRTLTIATTVRASGEVPIPIAFGYHPYFRMPGVERSAWAVEIPVSERVVLDSEKLPTVRAGGGRFACRSDRVKDLRRRVRRSGRATRSRGRGAPDRGLL